MRVCFIINPRAGRLRNRKSIVKQIREFIGTRHLDAEVVLTEYPRHAIALADGAVERGCDLVVACGGDGTVNEVAQKLTETDVCFGILPCGSGNGLARHLKIPRNLSGSLDLLLKGETRRIDTGIADGWPFVNVMGVGFDALISDRFNRLKRRGILPYLKVAATSFLSFSPSLYQTTINGLNEEYDAWVIAVANSSQYGNNAFIAPRAEVDDGQLNLVVINNHDLWHVPSLAGRLFGRSLDRHSKVITRTGARFLIRRREGGLIHTDGEPHIAGTDIQVNILRASLLMKLPARKELSLDLEQGVVPRAVVMNGLTRERSDIW